MARILAVDLGTRRVGLAVTDPLAMLASPYDTIDFRTMPALVDRIVGLCREKEVQCVVVGLPVREDGREGEGCVRARLLCSRLRDRGCESVLWDETWTSRDAEAVLREAGKTRKTAKGKVDAIAASLILKDYLETTRRS